MQHNPMRTRRAPLAPTLALALAAGLAACGGGDDSTAGSGGGGGGGGAGSVSCDTALFVAGSVLTPSAAELGGYAGTYKGDEGEFGPNPGDPFVKSGTATMVLGADGAFSYKGTAYTAKSICIDKTAGAAGRWLYVHTDKGHMDITDKGEALGVSPADGATIFQDGRKQ